MWKFNISLIFLSFNKFFLTNLIKIFWLLKYMSFLKDNSKFFVAGALGILAGAGL